MKKSNKKGFTIVELVIVIAVIAILAAVLIPTFSNVIEKANESAALQAAKNAYTEYLADNTQRIVAGKNLVIKYNDYYATVTDNKLNATVTKTVPENLSTAYTVVSGTFNGCTVYVANN